MDDETKSGKKRAPHPLSEGVAVPDQSKPAGSRTIFEKLNIPPVLVPHIKRFGLSGLVVLLFVVAMGFGFSPITIITGKNEGPERTTSATMVVPADASEAVLGEFVRKVVEENQRLWLNVFVINGLAYKVPKVRLTGSASSTEFLIGAEALEVNITEKAPQLTLLPRGEEPECGLDNAVLGPAYCPKNETIYVDLRHFQALLARYGDLAPQAMAIVIAQQFGHHAQKKGKVLDVWDALRETGPDEDIADLAIRLNLQADCYAGIWAAWAVQGDLMRKSGMLAAVNSASDMPAAIVENARSAGVPKAYGYGSLSQRSDWFTKGHSTAQPGKCNALGLNQI